jgi:OFA family oxalate/formate antiporter-like MFS transporter
MRDRLVRRLANGRVYYGWYIVGVVLATGIPRVGLNGSFFGIFLKPMSEEFGWTRAETTGAVTIGTLIAAGLAFGLGRVLDRFGPRWMMAGGLALLAASYFGLARVNSLLAFYAIYPVGRSMMQSATGHTLMYALVSKWFIRRRATAISAATMGGYIGGVLLAPVTQAIIDSSGWRDAWTFFGVLTLVIALFPAILLLRRIPEDLGLLPDGDLRESVEVASAGSTVDTHPERVATEAPKPVEELSLRLGEAMRTPTFWFLTLMITVNSVATTGITFHMVPHYSDVGISDAAAAGSISFLTIGAIASVFVWGFFADRMGAKRVLLVVIGTLWLGALLVANATTAMTAYISAGVFGLGMAGYGLLSEVVWADFFGREHLGSIRGVTMMFQLMGNASGSLIAAFLFDWRGDYGSAFNVILVLFAVSFLMLVLSKRPRLRTRD